MATVTDYYSKHLKNPSDNKIIYPKTSFSNVFADTGDEIEIDPPYVYEDYDNSLSAILPNKLRVTALGQIVNRFDTLPSGNSFINKFGSYAATYYPKGSYVLLGDGYWYKLTSAVQSGYLISSENATRVYIGDEISSLNSDLTSVDLSSSLSYDTGVSNYMSRSSMRKIGNMVIVTLSFQNTAQINAWARFAKLSIPHDYGEIAIKMDGAYVYSAWDATNQLYGIFLGDSTLAAGYHACQLIFTHT